MMKFRMYQICILVTANLYFGLVQAQDLEWYESSCAWKIDSDNFGSIDLEENLGFEKYKGKELEYCQNITAFIKNFPLITEPKVGEQGTLIFRNNKNETICAYEVIQIIPRTDPLIIEIINTLYGEGSNSISITDEMFELFNKKKLKESVIYYCDYLTS